MDFGDIGMKIISKLFGDTTKNVATSTTTVIVEPTIVVELEPVVRRVHRIPPPRVVIDVVPDDRGAVIPLDAKDWNDNFVTQANAEQRMVEDGCAIGSWEELPKNS